MCLCGFCFALFFTVGVVFCLWSCFLFCYVVSLGLLQTCPLGPVFDRCSIFDLSVHVICLFRPLVVLLFFSMFVSCVSVDLCDFFTPVLSSRHVLGVCYMFVLYIDIYVLSFIFRHYSVFFFRGVLF